MDNYVFIGLKNFTMWLAMLFAIGAIISFFVTRYTDIGRDDSDTNTDRSNMRVLTDHKTGLQYLAVCSGGITPRLDENGKQIRIEEK
jgi:preprotein translocase subunit SecG